MTKVLIMKNTLTGATISEHCWAVTRQEVNRIVQKALDGTTYTQIIGTPSKYIDVEGEIIDSRLDLLRAAEQSAVILSLSNDEGTLYGRIESLQESRKVTNGRRKFTATLAWEAGA